jgi:hypothetical protein
MKARSVGCWIVLAGALLAPSGATATSVANGGFESGSLSGWQVHRATYAGNWFAYEGTVAPIGHKRGADPVQPPPEGSFAAIADEADPDTLILYQDIAVGSAQGQTLSLLAYYDSYAPLATPTPDTLSVNPETLGGQRNQQFRIDLTRPTAPLESLDPADVLATLFETKPGGSLKMSPTKLTAALGPFAGQTVRLRIAVAAHEEVLNAGVDSVKVSVSGASSGGSSGGGRGHHGAAGGGWSRLHLHIAKVRANRRNGTVFLRIWVPGPGRIWATGRKLRRSRSRARSARFVKIRLRPTRSGRARLRRRHELRTKVAVRFKPATGAIERASARVVVKLKQKS